MYIHTYNTVQKKPAKIHDILVKTDIYSKCGIICRNFIADKCTKIEILHIQFIVSYHTKRLGIF